MLVLRLWCRAEDAKRSVSGRLGRPVLYLEASRHPLHLTNNRRRLQKEGSIEGESKMYVRKLYRLFGTFPVCVPQVRNRNARARISSA